MELQIPSAKEYAAKLSQVEADEVAAEARARRQADEDKKAMIEQLSKPSELSDEEVSKRAVKLIEAAVKNRRQEVQVYRFPNSMCTDGGRAINQGERGWEDTLMGVPKEVYMFWQRHLRDRGYGLRVEIIDFPNGMPGDVGMTLTWT